MSVTTVELVVRDAKKRVRARDIANRVVQQARALAATNDREYSLLLSLYDKLRTGEIRSYDRRGPEISEQFYGKLHRFVRYSVCKTKQKGLGMPYKQLEKNIQERLLRHLGSLQTRFACDLSTRLIDTFD